MTFNERKERETQRYNALIHAKNVKNEEFYNGIYDRYQNEVLSRRHIPLEWRYDFNEAENPFFMERIMVNAAFNSGAVEFGGKIALAVRIEGADRKSYFAIAQSDSGIDNFTFGKYPVKLPKTDEIDTNVYDMRLTKHEDGCIYGLFCSEVKDYGADDTSTAIARCGIVRTKDLERWERLPNLDARFQQRNVVLHPEFVNGKYLLYTRPADGFVEVGGGGGIGCAFTD
ncbi:MAG: glycosidase, partial [Clostridiales bacterium]|nr:glycosidase [Clostridiales bacterium]